MAGWLTNQGSDQSTNQPTKYLRKCMKQNPPWEADNFPASKDIPHILWKSKFHYSYNSLPLVPNLSQINPVHALQSYFI